VLAFKKIAYGGVLILEKSALYDKNKVNFKRTDVFFEGLETFDLVYLGQVHLILAHGILALERPLLAVVAIHGLVDWVLISVCFNVGRKRVCLVLLQNLLPRQNLLNLLVHFCFVVSHENTVDCGEFVVHD